MLKFTKNQSKILKLFFDNPGKSFYFRQIGILINRQPGVFQKEIEKLVKSGLLLDNHTSTCRFFKLNKKHILFKNLENIYHKISNPDNNLKYILHDTRIYHKS